MKKIILIAAMVLGFAVAAVAQPRAIGLRGGYGVELSYQHTLGENFVEANLGLTGFNALNVKMRVPWASSWQRTAPTPRKASIILLRSFF